MDEGGCGGVALGGIEVDEGLSFLLSAEGGLLTADGDVVTLSEVREESRLGLHYYYGL